MDIEAAKARVLKERTALEDSQGLSNPSYISEHMQALSQYVAILDDLARDKEEGLEKTEATLFKQYRSQKMSVNGAQTQIKYEMMSDRAEMASLNRLVSSSWKFINACQSRLKYLVEEAKSTI
jgi:chromosome segregation ATPase